MDEHCYFEESQVNRDDLVDEQTLALGWVALSGISQDNDIVV